MDEFFGLLDDLAWSDQGYARCDCKECHLDLDNWTKTYDRDDFFQDSNDCQREQEHQQIHPFGDSVSSYSGKMNDSSCFHDGITSESPFLVPVPSAMDEAAVGWTDAHVAWTDNNTNVAAREDMPEPSSNETGQSSFVHQNMSQPMNLARFPGQQSDKKDAMQYERPFLQDSMLDPNAGPIFPPPSPGRACSMSSMSSKCTGGIDPGTESCPYPGIPIIAPLTAYNYFYRNERDTIVKGMTKASDPLPPSDTDFTPRKMAALLQHRWTVDPYKKKRQHKKTHGIIDFTTLARVISQRWKKLPEHGREFYREVANVNQRRYEAYWAERRSTVGAPSVT